MCARLSDEGFAILGTNVRVGRLEIDVIARRGRLLVFCEVRARTGRRGPHPLETIDLDKQRRIRRAALAWAIAHEARGHAMRFDAAAVIFEGGEASVDYVEDAF